MRHRARNRSLMAGLALALGLVAAGQAAALSDEDLQMAPMSVFESGDVRAEQLSEDSIQRLEIDRQIVLHARDAFEAETGEKAGTVDLSWLDEHAREASVLISHWEDEAQQSVEEAVQVRFQIDANGAVDALELVN